MLCGFDSSVALETTSNEEGSGSPDVVLERRERGERKSQVREEKMQAYEEIKSLPLVRWEIEVSSNSRHGCVKVSEVGMAVSDFGDEVRESLVSLLVFHLHTLEGRVWRYPNTSLLCSNSFNDSVDNLERESNSVLNGSSEFIGSLVRTGL